MAKVVQIFCIAKTFAARPKVPPFNLPGILSQAQPPLINQRLNEIQEIKEMYVLKYSWHEFIDLEMVNWMVSQHLAPDIISESFISCLR